MKSQSKSRSRTWTIILIIAFLLFLILIVLLGYRYMSMKVMANISPPQVLIHRPYNQEFISEGIGTTIHATARSENGISRMELWVDSDFIYAVEPHGGESITPLVINKPWVPRGIGTHEIIIRAIDSTGVEGVGSVIVTVSEASKDEIAAASKGINPLEEVPGDAPVSDETGEPTAEENGQSSSGGGAGPPPSGRADEPAAAPPEDEAPPESASSTSDFTFLEFLFGGITLFGADDDEGPTEEDGLVLLYLEGLGLETNEAYEGVHCYVNFGESSPVWYPDTDLNQATDESFQLIGDRLWNIVDYLSDDNAILTAWPKSEAVTAKVNCVAVSSGGTQAIDLGDADIVAPEDEWDGITRNVEASDEGWFRFSYRIRQQELVSKELDPTIPVPFNVRIDDRRQELIWDWENIDGAGNGVVGFMVYVNDTMVFTANEDGNRTRAARIPYSWFTPPCRTEYEFTVRAYKYPYPDGDYSDASEPAVLPNPDEPLSNDCQPEFVIDFHTLRTGATPADGRENNWAGDIGPITGSFYANGEGRLFHGYDLRPNQTYDLHSMIWNSTGEQSHFTIEPTPGEIYLIGFDLARYLGWDGYDTICESYYDEVSYYEMMEYGTIEGTLYSLRNDDTGHSICQVDYTISHVAGTPLGVAGGDSLPLPWLDVTGISIEPETNELIVEVTNNGSAMWANQGLRVRYEGQAFGVSNHGYVEDDFVLEVGETKQLRPPFSITANSLWDYCIKLDPDGEVLELYEQSSVLDHSVMEYCMPNPDLHLSETQYDFNTNTLRMRIWNHGQTSNSLGTSALDLADLLVGIDIKDSDRDIISPVGTFAGQILENGDGIWLEWPLAASIHEELEAGYTVTLDPLDDIAERDEDNNSIEVPQGKDIRLVWNGVFIRWYPDSILYECPAYGRWGDNDYEVWVDVYARSEFSNRHIVSWNYEGSVDSWNEAFRFIPSTGWDADSYTMDFFIQGEEDIVVEVRGEQERESMGSGSETYESNMNWRTMGTIAPDQRCTPESESSGGDRIHIYPTNRNWGFMCGSWSVYINRCWITTP